MSFYGFMAFDPYLSFAEGERGFREKIFLRADGTPTATWYDVRHDGKGYLSSLWRIGRDAYATITEREGWQPSRAYFKEAAAHIRELEKDFAPQVQRLIDDGQLTLFEDRDSPAVTDLARTLEDAPDGWLLEVFMRIVRPSVVSGHIAEDDLPDFELLLLIVAILYLDYYIIAENLDAADLDVFSELVQVNIASAKLYRETVNTVNEAVSALGRRSAKARHAPTNQQKAAALAAWDAHGANVSSMAAFARTRHKEFGVTERTLYEWVRDHRKTNA